VTAFNAALQAIEKHRCYSVLDEELGHGKYVCSGCDWTGRWPNDADAHLADMIANSEHGDFYSPVQWGVWWSEVGFAPKLTQFDEDEQGARIFSDFLKKQYLKRNRTMRPMLLSGRVDWQEVKDART
jgi:hypothetical protein